MRRFIHPLAGVTNRKANVRSRLELRRRLPKAAIDATGFESQLDAPRLGLHRLPRVGGEVEDDLVDLMRVGAHDGHVASDVEPELDASGKRRAKQLDRSRENRLEVQRSQRMLVRAAEEQDAPDELAGAMAGVEDLLEALGRWVT